MDEDIYSMNKVLVSIDEAIMRIESLDDEAFQDRLSDVHATLEDLRQEVEYAIDNAERIANDYS